MKAKDLREAIGLLDPERELTTDEELRDWFVAREDSPIDKMRALFESEGSHKILITGHRGSGKSTELRKLAKLLEGDLHIVTYSVKRVLDMFDLTYVDVLLSMALELIKSAESIIKTKKIKIELIESILAFTKEITKDVETGVKGQAEAGTELNLLVAKLGTKLRLEGVTRETVREKVVKRIGDLQENIDFLCREVKRHHKPVLFIIEDLDKTSLEKAKELFFLNAPSLTEPGVSVIFTFPIALRRDDDFRQIQMNFGDPYTLPNIKVRKSDNSPDTKGIKLLARVVTNRLEPSLFDPDAIRRLAACSGGIPREMMVLARNACLDARVKKAERIEAEHVAEAASSLRRDFQVILSQAQWKLLKTVHKTKKIDNTDEYRRLLHLVSVLEYRNEDVWYDVHPLIEPLLDRMSGE